MYKKKNCDKESINEEENREKESIHEKENDLDLLVDKESTEPTKSDDFLVDKESRESGAKKKLSTETIQAVEVIKLAMKCLSNAPSGRPEIKDVLKRLD